MSGGWALLAILGLTAITVLTRGFLLLPEREVPIPPWLREALRHAPLAALVAVVAPEIVLTQGHLIHSWQHARLFAAAASALWFWRQRSILGTILVGSAVLLTLHLGLGWAI
jgi:branched-subunit amino acid transport protein